MSPVPRPASPSPASTQLSRSSNRCYYNISRQPLPPLSRPRPRPPHTPWTALSVLGSLAAFYLLSSHEAALDLALRVCAPLQHHLWSDCFFSFFFQAIYSFPSLPWSSPISLSVSVLFPLPHLILSSYPILYLARPKSCGSQVLSSRTGVFTESSGNHRLSPPYSG